jgi:hypothetical protein
MSYINFQLFHSKGLKPEDLYYLAGIKQIDKEVLEEIPSDVLLRLEALSLLTSIKGKKGDNPVYNVRLSANGKKLLKEIFTESIAGDIEEVLLTWLSKYYTDRGKEIGNPNRVKKLLAWFSSETGIYKNDLIKLFVDFLQDDYVDEASRVLEFTLFYPRKFTTDKGKTVAYEAKPDIFDSWLYKHFDKNRERLIKTFEDYRL